MSERDDLETILRNVSWGIPYPMIQAMAQSVIDEGWKPATPAIVQSIAELDDYPKGTVLRGGSFEGSRTYTRSTFTFFCWTSSDPITGRLSSEDLFVNHGPLQVIDVPSSTNPTQEDTK